MAEVYTDQDLRILAVRGVLGLRSTSALRRSLVKALADGVPVIADVSGLVVAWAPGVHVFVAAMQACGGWPEARLTLAGPVPPLAAALRGSASALHVVPDIAAARRLGAARPARVTRSRDLPAHSSSPARARQSVREAGAAWRLDQQPLVEVVASELVTNCVVHARSGCTLSLTLDHRGVTVSVRDVLPPPVGDAWVRGGGLLLVDELSRSWGVRAHPSGGKAVWATLPTNPS